MPADLAPPFQPRPLTRSERRHGDLYLYQSPKVVRKVELIGCLATAVALQFEFDPDVTAFVERPRTLEVGERHIELTFWTQEARGRERFWLLVPTDESVHLNSPRREHRNARMLIEAAQAAHISLYFIYEDEMRKRTATTGTWYRALPYVQTAMTLPNRAALRVQVRTIFDVTPRTTLDQIEGQLRGFHAADVRAVALDLVHAGELSLCEATRLSRFSVLERRASHDHT